ncbi:hypothetical protein KUCAC02_016762, partial [Chaenocephalus aceratus]
GNQNKKNNGRFQRVEITGSRSYIKARRIYMSCKNLDLASGVGRSSPREPLPPSSSL